MRPQVTADSSRQRTGAMNASTTVRTVLGTVDASALGRVLVHEHIRIRYPGQLLDPNAPDENRADCVERAVERLHEAAEHGVRTMVDPCPIELDREPELMAEVSERSGVNVVCSTGFYFENDAIGIPFYWRARTSEEVAELYLHEIEHGIGDTGIRPGVIKIASGAPPGEHDKKVIAGAAIAARESATPIVSHCEHSRGGDVQQAILAEHDADLGRAVIGHQDEEADVANLRAIAERGSFVGIDRIGSMLAPDEQRADNVAALVAEGRADHVCLAHDSSCCFHSARFPYPLPAGSPPSTAEAIHPTFSEQMTRPYTYLFDTFLPMLRDRGVSDADIDQMLVVNPRRLLAGA